MCCATGREETIDCPPDCEYLREAHRHEKHQPLDVSKLPNQDIEITEEFLQEHEILLAFTAIAVYEGATESSAATDWDVREALESLVAIYRALKSGLYIEPALPNPYAAAIVSGVQEAIEVIRAKEKEKTGTTTVRDAALLGVIAFLQRLEYSHNNGRKRCRAFIDFLSDFYTAEEEQEPGPDQEPLIL